MGDLAKYIAEVIEFVVAGVLVLFSLLLLGFALVHPDLSDLPDQLGPVTSGALGPVLGIAVIYALGILAEGVSRMLFEKGPISRVLFKGGLEARTERAFTTMAGTKKRKTQIEKDLGKPVDGLVPKDYAHLREIWRMRIISRDAALATQIDGQLKRLRVERAAALSGFIACFALALDLALDAWMRGGVENVLARWVLLGGVAAVTLCAIVLSVVRLQRFLDTIIRCHGALPEVTTS